MGRSVTPHAGHLAAPASPVALAAVRLGSDFDGDVDVTVQAGWVELARTGDEEAFTALVRAHQSCLYAVALRLTGKPDDAQDVVQDAFLQAWQGLPMFRGDAQFSTWITRIVINRCHNLRRGTRPTEPLWGDDGAPTVPPADAVVIASQRWQAAQAALLDLPFDQRAALVLNTFAGYTHAETGRILGVTESAAKVRVHRARKTLLARLQDWR